MWAYMRVTWQLRGSREQIRYSLDTDFRLGLETMSCDHLNKFCPVFCRNREEPRGYFEDVEPYILAFPEIFRDEILVPSRARQDALDIAAGAAIAIYVTWKGRVREMRVKRSGIERCKYIEVYI